MKDFIVDPATKFNFEPADFVPFKDKKVCEYVRSLSGKDLEKRKTCVQLFSCFLHLMILLCCPIV